MCCIAVSSVRIVGRCAFLALLCHAVGCCWVLEQPRSSLIFKSERMLWLLERMNVTQLSSLVRILQQLS